MSRVTEYRTKAAEFIAQAEKSSDLNAAALSAGQRRECMNALASA